MRYICGSSAARIRFEYFEKVYLANCWLNKSVIMRFVTLRQPRSSLERAVQIGVRGGPAVTRQVTRQVTRLRRWES